MLTQVSETLVQCNAKVRIIMNFDDNLRMLLIITDFGSLLVLDFLPLVGYRQTYSEIFYNFQEYQPDLLRILMRILV